MVSPLLIEKSYMMQLGIKNKAPYIFQQCDFLESRISIQRFYHTHFNKLILMIIKIFQPDQESLQQQ
ncbi:unnamed protein product [Paramecium pentaurelia]|uniref:Uncharacterized protein n=1 Tax=Paramecium pentaurelia TaxID=43138 RepID=A0A8S1YHM7_9CILI|nr:unnamed protein product [Paramecium pentaurelia]CAD8213645.1 unnamed protein product [Paramecium pentaurelia]